MTPLRIFALGALLGCNASSVDPAGQDAGLADTPIDPDGDVATAADDVGEVNDSEAEPLVEMLIRTRRTLAQLACQCDEIPEPACVESRMAGDIAFADCLRELDTSELQLLDPFLRCELETRDRLASCLMDAGCGDDELDRCYGEQQRAFSDCPEYSSAAEEIHEAAFDCAE